MSELPTNSTIDSINRKLELEYGHDIAAPLARYRVVWSEDQFEVRYGTFTNISPEGLYYGEETGYKEVPKYRQYLPEQWVLEKLTPVPDGSELTVKMSYEPFWSFGIGNLPSWEHCKVLIDTVHAKLAEHESGAKYKAPFGEGNTKEEIEYRVNKLQELLFADTSSVSDALHTKDGISLAGLDLKGN